MDTEIKILLGQISFHKFPTVNVTVNDQTQSLAIDSDTWVTFNLDLPPNEHISLTVEYYGKINQDCIPTKNLDTAVIIKDISLNGIIDKKFIWEGVYQPNYPKHYEPKITKLTKIQYLGWNGVWTLEITAPLFTWIHKTLDLGWIYD